MNQVWAQLRSEPPRFSSALPSRLIYGVCYTPSIILFIIIIIVTTTIIIVTTTIIILVISSSPSAVHIPPVSRALVQFPFYKLSNSATLSFPDSEPIPTPDFVICFFHDKQTLTLWVSYSNEKKEVLKIIFILISWTNILFWLVGQREPSTAAG